MKKELNWKKIMAVIVCAMLVYSAIVSYLYVQKETKNKEQIQQNIIYQNITVYPNLTYNDRVIEYIVSAQTIEERLLIFNTGFILISEIFYLQNFSTKIGFGVIQISELQQLLNFSKEKGFFELNDTYFDGSTGAIRKIYIRDNNTEKTVKVRISSETSLEGFTELENKLIEIMNKVLK